MMKFQRILLAVPILFSLTACSCGNKVSQEGAMDDSTSGMSGVEISETASFFKGRVADRVFFATDKNTLNAESKQTLSEQAELLKGRDNLSVVVEGHCDERGPREYNLALGERRANAAKDFLVKSGVNSEGLSTVSYGKERPEVQGHDAEAWAQNRRAVTVVSTR